ncbi:Telomerase ribonucleoprotein complex RNA binding domain-containing protein [Lipomyces starkeyi]
MTMHGLIQGISVRDIPWLGKYDCAKMPLGEYKKRSIILSEFVYWLFDSLIPSIVRGNFFVTDSATTRNRLVYFRHDVWHRLSQPSLNQIISTMFDEIPTKLLKTIAEGCLGNYRDPKIVKKHQSSNEACPSSITIRTLNKEALGSAILGTTDALPKLLAFQKSLKDQGLLGRDLYFVKVDIQSCFDSIPPVQAYRAAKKFFRLNEYRIRQFITVSMKNNDVFKRFISAAYPGPLDDSLELEYDPMENSEFALFVKRTVKNFENKIFIDGAKVTFYERQELLRLLVEHIAGHIVQIGRKFYKQKKGIPQGSVVSTFLCNLLYSQLELEKLAFTSDNRDSLLLRLTDDFLYITLDRDKAVTFFRRYPEYGATINPAKSLTNFDLKMRDLHVPVLTRTSEFPYCGLTIHTTTLNVKRDLFKNPDQGRSFISYIIQFSSKVL